ncbi:MAG: GTP-binding protein [Nitratireductor sp.]
MASKSDNGRKPLPVIILTGFLGAGKTSLLNRLHAAGLLQRTAIIINEFGEVGLDRQLFGATSDEVVELGNGCICCTVRGALVDTLSDIAARDVDKIVIETTGLADPGPVIQAIIGHPELSNRLHLEAVLTLIDLVNGEAALAEFPEAQTQAALADRILFTKSDIAHLTDAATGRLCAAISGTNPAVDFIVLTDETDLPSLLRKPAFTPSREVVSHTDHCSHEHGPDGHDHAHDHHHADPRTAHSGISSLVLVHDTPLPILAVETFCELLASAYGSQVLRLKGIVAVAENPLPLVVHGVRGTFHEPEFLRQWPDDDRSTRIVVILKGMDPEFVRRLFDGFANRMASDTPDRTALMDNPLAIGGMKF